MYLAVGNFIIRCAINEDTVLLINGGSTAQYAQVITGALIEDDNRCYWRSAVYSNTWNSFYNVKTWNGRGFIMGKKIEDNAPMLQAPYNVNTGAWILELSGNTMIVNGQSVQTYLVKSKKDETLYWTIPQDGGQLYVTTLMEDTTLQEFYFHPMTYGNMKLATPTAMTTDAGVDYIIGTDGVQDPLLIRWKSSSTNRIYEERYRTRRYDMLGIPEEWTPWTNWGMVTATKTTVKQIMQRDTALTTPAVDNENYLQADIQVEDRITSATRENQYITTGSVTHGRVVSGLIRKWIVPTVNFTQVTCRQHGLAIAYNCDYTVSGNTINVISILDGPEKLIENYILTGQDYQGEIIIPWDVISRIPTEHAPLDITIEYVEANGIVSYTDIYTLQVTYGPEFGYPFTPVYSLTDRMTIEAKLDVFDSIDGYIRRTDLLGNETWAKVEEFVKEDDPNHRYFDIPQPYGEPPTVMWVVSHKVNDSIEWGYRRETLSNDLVINTKYYTWNWVDDSKVPHAYILKYRANSIMQPADVITLPATKFVTTGRDYPVFRYSKSVDRQLDIEGAILHNEDGDHSTKEDAEAMISANHAVYRQPDGKWYQVALKTISFTKEQLYYTIQVQQEAETR